jgi:molybdopterin converting factor small subunit
MPSIRIPIPIRAYVNGAQDVKVQGHYAGEAVESLLVQFPALRPHLTNARGELRPFVNLFIGENNIRELQGLETPLNDDDQLILIPSIAGG